MCSAPPPSADTIAAVATPPGRGGIAILRVSGPLAEEIGLALLGGKALPDRRMVYGRLAFAGEPLDEAMAVLMRAPRSYTREDVLELHCHGGDAACQRVLEAVLALGARPAAPGEFTRRAFENGRIDLTQAEAVMRLIGAQGEAAAREALRQLDGAVARGVLGAKERLLAMLARIAACTDFPEEIEEEETAQAQALAKEAEALALELRDACDARRGRALDQGLSVVLAGKPNVGKSSLLNVLLGEERAIVTPQPGTTRDTVHGALLLWGVRVNLTDTAGLRGAEGEAESLGIERARRAMETADLLLVVLDASLPLSDGDAALLRDTRNRDRLVILNKTDLPPGWEGHSPFGADVSWDLAVSALTGEGVDALKSRVADFAAGFQSGGALLTQARHVDAANRAARSLADMAQALRGGLPVDLAAIDARDALHALGEITGENAEDSVVDAVFRDFCVGK